MNVGELSPVLQLIRSLGEVRLLLDVEVIAPCHYEMLRCSLDRAIALVPVRSFYLHAILLILQHACEVLQEELLFPKLHTLFTHAIEDMKSKGPLKHSNTILGEARHPQFKADFRRTDGRDVEVQVRFLWIIFILVLIKFRLLT